MPADTWTDVARMVGCYAVTAAGASPALLLTGTVAIAVRWWATLTPVVLTIHALVNVAFVATGHEVEEHPLVKATPHPALLILQACVLAPFIEELVFRGVLLYGLRLVREWAVWVILVAAVGFAAGTGGWGPAAFLGIVVIGWVGLRTQGADGSVYASAALFAAVHSSVWPTPVPLFALGLGLGWVAVRTNGILAPVVVHGLFNAVSVLFVLSSGAK